MSYNLIFELKEVPLLTIFASVTILNGNFCTRKVFFAFFKITFFAIDSKVENCI